MAETKSKSIGALWAKTSKSGQKFYSGVIKLKDKDIPIVVFKNNEKKSDKSPDLSILLSDRPSTPRAEAKASPAAAPKPAPEPAIPIPAEEESLF